MDNIVLTSLARIGVGRLLSNACIPYFSPEIVYYTQDDNELVVYNNRSNSITNRIRLDIEVTDTDKIFPINVDTVAIYTNENRILIIGDSGQRVINIPEGSIPLIMDATLVYAVINSMNLLSIVEVETGIEVDKIQLIEGNWKIVTTFANEIIVADGTVVWKYSDRDYVDLTVIVDRWFSPSLFMLDASRDRLYHLDNDKIKAFNVPIRYISPTYCRNIVSCHDHMTELYMISEPIANVNPLKMDVIATLPDILDIPLINRSCYAEDGTYNVSYTSSGPPMPDHPSIHFTESESDLNIMVTYCIGNSDTNNIGMFMVRHGTKVLSISPNELLLCAIERSTLYTIRISLPELNRSPIVTYDIKEWENEYQRIIGRDGELYAANYQYLFINGELHITVSEVNSLPCLVVNLDTRNMALMDMEGTYRPRSRKITAVDGNLSLTAVYTNTTCINSTRPLSLTGIWNRYQHDVCDVLENNEFRTDILVSSTNGLSIVRLHPSTLIPSETIKLINGPVKVYTTNSPRYVLIRDTEGTRLIELHQWIPKGSMTKRARMTR